jgi:hypothetical protein
MLSRCPAPGVGFAGSTDVEDTITYLVMITQVLETTCWHAS